MVRDPGFPVFDADNHLYEPPVALLEHLPAAYDGAVEFVQVRGRTRIALNGRITDYMPNPTFERVAAPGVHADFYRGTNAAGLTRREMTGRAIDCPPAFREPAPRLALLDEQGIAQALVYPTLANLVEMSASDDPDLVHAIVHSLNQWLHEVWTFDYRDRLFAVPVITLAIVENAIAELDWVLARGARAILIRPAPVKGLRGSRSFALAEFDPFWARVQEAGVGVAVHATYSIFNDYLELWEPQRSANAFVSSPFKEWAIAHRDVEDTFAALICHGTLSRFPNLRVASVENGAEWVPHLLAGLSKIYRQMPQEFAEHPVDVFHRNVWVNPFWENDVKETIDVVGADRVIFGSDYPHPEGMAEPLAYLDELAGFDPALQQRVMRDNALAFLGAPTTA
ncbi:amidohydrolase family protein [Frankia sp. Cas3]|uniref:amidohydrolase family protein n=1 Tax=Frankia sp. Cas3 TaxID=3073926 RepID=UPI003A0FBC02